MSGYSGEHELPEPEQLGVWTHCTQALRDAGVDCLAAPRRPCACTFNLPGHDHLVGDSPVTGPSERVDRVANWVRKLTERPEIWLALVKLGWTPPP